MMSNMNKNSGVTFELPSDKVKLPDNKLSCDMIEWFISRDKVSIFEPLFTLKDTSSINARAVWDCVSVEVSEGTEFWMMIPNTTVQRFILQGSRLVASNSGSCTEEIPRFVLDAFDKLPCEYNLAQFTALVNALAEHVRKTAKSDVVDLSTITENNIIISEDDEFAIEVPVAVSSHKTKAALRLAAKYFYELNRAQKEEHELYLQLKKRYESTETK
ncbi:hypothetical protein GR7B_00049 [Vibrio phage vB_VcorM_GR7B]|nr:hypothetical protein GR7B_00049 [Vibrio phage vB_VcorM_GR7B]